MNIIESIEYFENDIKRSTEKLETYKFLGTIFAGLDFEGLAKGINMWVTWLDSSETYWVEFSVGYTEGAEQNLQPFIHAMCKHFSTEFHKEKNWNESALNYTARFVYNGYKFTVQVNDIVPKSCRVEETVELLSDDEIEEARQRALADVKTTRTIRKIVCFDADASQETE